MDGSFRLALLLLFSFDITFSAGSFSCPSGWTFGDTTTECYSRRSTQKTWHAAESDCENLGGHLVSITSDSENSVVMGLRGSSSSSSSDVWIGLHDTSEEGTFVWVDGTDSSHREWADGEPNNLSRNGNKEGDCVRMISSGKWRDSYCSSSYNYVCQIPAVALTDCQSGWKRSGRSCYKYFSNRKIWNSAESDCAFQVGGGHLVSIASAFENSFVYNLSGTSAWSSWSSGLWIGFHKGNAGSLVWTDGTSGSYKNWATSNSNGDCVRMLSDGKWGNYSCSINRRYMCEHSLITVTPSVTVQPASSTAAANTRTETQMLFTAFRSRSKMSTVKQDSLTAPSPISVTTTAVISTLKQVPMSTGTLFRSIDVITIKPMTSPSAASTITTATVPSDVTALEETTVTTVATVKLKPTAAFVTVTSAEITSQKHIATLATTVTSFPSKSTEIIGRQTPSPKPSKVTTVIVTTVPTKERESNNTTGAPEKQTISETTTMYVGVGVAVGVCVISAIILVFIFVGCRRLKHDSAVESMSMGNTTFVGATGSTSGSTENAKMNTKQAKITEQRQPKTDTELFGEDGYTRVCFFSNKGYMSEAKFRGTETIPAVESKSMALDLGTSEYHYDITSPGDHGIYNTPTIYYDLETSADYYDIPDVTSLGDHGDTRSNHYAVLCPNSAEIEEKSHHSGYETLTKAAEVRWQHGPPPIEGSEDEEKYWEPASTEEELYGQLENKRFRHIERCDVTNQEKIGSGEFGVVEKALWQLGRDKIVVAIKSLSETSGKEDSIKLLQEATTNGQFHHKNVVRLHGVVTAGSPIMLVLEFMSNGDLKGHLVKQRPEYSGRPCPVEMPVTLLQMCRDVALGMEYLSRKSFVHRDLAARNILLNEKLTCKIGDFGMARDVSDDNYYVTKGGKIPIRWCAPEVWNYKKFSSSSDAWSYGVLLYEIWSVGQRPFGRISNAEIMRNVERGYRLPPPPGCSRFFYHLMIDCWNPDSHERPSFGNILQRLAAPDKSLINNGLQKPSIVGNLGDELDVSRECYKELQGVYGWN